MGRVSCGLAGVHRIRLPRLTIYSGRLSDFFAGVQLLRDPEARHWLGVAPPPPAPYPPRLRDPVLGLNSGHLLFVGADNETGHVVANVTLHVTASGDYTVFGVVDPARRGEGYGEEALTAVLFLAHQHFGLARVTATHERGNERARRVLARAGFRPADGPAAGTLLDGRVVDLQWWEDLDHTARRRCRDFPAQPRRECGLVQAARRAGFDIPPPPGPVAESELITGADQLDGPDIAELGR